MKITVAVFFILLTVVVSAQIDTKQSYTKPEEKTVLALIDTASARNDVRHYSEAKELLNEAKQSVDSLSSNFLLYRYYQIAGDYYFQTLQVGEALVNYKMSLAYGRKEKDSAYMANCYSGLANCYTFNKDFKKAIYYHEKTLSFITDKESGTYYRSLSNLGLAYVEADQLERALDAFFKVKAYFESVDYVDGISLIELNIGELYREKFNKPELAKKHYRSAIQVNNKSGDLYRQSQAYHNLALVYVEEENLDSAFYYLNRAIQYKKDVGDIGGIAVAMNTKGRAYTQAKKYTEAIKAFNETLRISEENGIPPGIYYGNYGKGIVYMEMKAYSEALPFLLKAKEVAESLQALDITKDVNDELYQLYKSTNNYEEALKINEELIVINDSLSSLKMNREVEDLRLKYETDLAEKENLQLKEKEKVQNKLISQKNVLLYILIISIVFLVVMAFVLYKSYRQRNVAYKELKITSEELETQYERTKQDEARLEVTNNLKDRIFSVLGHDLRTPLLNIIGLLDSISQVEFSKKELEYILNHLKSETNNTLKTLQNILQWSQLQIDENSTKFKVLNEDAIILEIITTYKSNANSKNININYSNTNEQTFYGDENQFKSIVVNQIGRASCRERVSPYV